MYKIQYNGKNIAAKDLPIEYLELSPVATRALKLAKIDTLEKLGKVTDKELSRLRGIGEKRLPEVIEAREKCRSLGQQAISVAVNGISLGEIFLPANTAVKKVMFNEDDKTIDIICQDN